MSVKNELQAKTAVNFRVPAIKLTYKMYQDQKHRSTLKQSCLIVVGKIVS